MRTLRNGAVVLILTVGLLGFDVVDLASPADATPVPVDPAIQKIDVAESVDPVAEAEERTASQPDTAEAEHTGESGATVPGNAVPEVRVDAEPEVLTPEIRTDEFGVVGVTWDAGSAPSAGTVVSVRVREDDGWSDWQVLDTMDSAPDPGTEDARHAFADAATEPFTTSGADAVQVRMDTGSGEVPEDVEVVAIDPGTSPADAAGAGGPLSAASAAAARPAVVTRAQWGADESLRRCLPSAMTGIKAAVVHHTAGTNSYTAAQSPALIRGIYAYHTRTLGWCDIGYNMLVDKYGTVFEGRLGSITQAIRGAHAGGFNEYTFGVSALGNYNEATPTDALVESIARVIAWRLAASFADPLGRVSLTSAGGGTAKYPAGRSVTLDVIMGHRDVGQTACPGANLYSRLGAIRSRVFTLMGPALVRTAISTLTPVQGDAVQVSARALTGQSWRLDVLDRCLGTVSTIATGTAARNQAITATWNTATASGPGSYTLSFTPSAGGVAGVTRRWTVTVGASPGAGVATDVPAQLSLVRTGATTRVDLSSTAAACAGTALRSLPVPLGATNPTEWEFFSFGSSSGAPADLVALRHTRTRSGKVEVRVLSGASGYTKMIMRTTPLAAGLDTDQWQFGVASYGRSGRPDLFAIRVAGGSRDKVEVRVLSSASGYQSFVARAVTGMAERPGDTVTALAGDPAGRGDVMVLVTAGTDSGRVEAYRLTASGGYASVSPAAVTPFKVAYVPSYRFGVTDHNRDGIADLVGTRVANTTSGEVEVQVVNGATAFGSFLARTPTGVPLSGALVPVARIR